MGAGVGLTGAFAAGRLGAAGFAAAGLGAVVCLASAEGFDVGVVVV